MIYGLLFCALLATLLLMPTIIWIGEKLNIRWIIASEKDEASAINDAGTSTP